MKRRIYAVAAATMLAFGGLVATAGSASAASPGTCVKTSSWNEGVWKWASATNTCTTTKRFYFRWDRAVDGSCQSLDRGWKRSEGRLYQARFAGLTTC